MKAVWISHSNSLFCNIKHFRKYVFGICPNLPRKVASLYNFLIYTLLSCPCLDCSVFLGTILSDRWTMSFSFQKTLCFCRRAACQYPLHSVLCFCPWSLHLSPSVLIGPLVPFEPSIMKSISVWLHHCTSVLGFCCGS